MVMNQGTIRTPSSKVGEKGMCKKRHGQEARQGTSNTPSGLHIHNEKAHLTFLEFHSPRETSISVTKWCCQAKLEPLGTEPERLGPGISV